VEAIWLAVEPLDMRAGTDTILARVVKVFGAARPHHAYLFANKSCWSTTGSASGWLRGASTRGASSGRTAT
jgi:hypothetical protein